MLRWIGLLWDRDRFELSYKNQYIKLTPKEFSLIGLLIQNPGRVYSRNQLIDLVWGMYSETEGRTVDSHVRNMREKSGKWVFPSMIIFTQYGAWATSGLESSFLILSIA